MANYADRDSSMAIRRNEFLSDVQAVATAYLAKHVSGPAAELVASSLTYHLADYWGGQLINIPKYYHWKLSKRDAEIYGAFNGHNYAELAKQYTMGERGLRKLLDRMRTRIAEAADKRTHDLFND